MTPSKILSYSCKVPHLQNVVYSLCPSYKTVILYLVAFLDMILRSCQEEEIRVGKEVSRRRGGSGADQGCKGN